MLHSGHGVNESERWSRKLIMDSKLPIELWPTVAEEVLIADQLESFRAKKDAVTLYFLGLPISEIVLRTGVCRTDLPRLVKKCLTLSGDGRIHGFRALIPYRRISPNQRTAELTEKRRHQQGGQSGAMSMTLKRFPTIEDDLFCWIRNQAKQQRVPEFRISPKTLHKIFLELLKSKGVGKKEWPFNTQYLGKRTIQKFMSKVLNENFVKSVNTRENEAAKAHIRTGTGHAPFICFDEPYDAVEIDSYPIDAFLTVAFKTPENTETEVMLERLWLIAAIDRSSSAVLAHRIVYRSEVTSDDVVGVVSDAISKRWVPKKLTIPAKYAPGGGWPNGVIPETLGACWTITFLDGALAHLSSAIHEQVHQKLGQIISWGAVGRFERRPNVEHLFNLIAIDVFHRLPSTTGSNPQNGRSPKAEENAIRFKIRAALAEEFTDLYVAKHNVTPSEGISFLSPIQFINYFLIQQNDHFLLRHIPQTLFDKKYMFSKMLQVTVRGSIKLGRRPYIQLDRCHYTSPVLRDLGNLIGTKIFVEIVDEEDFRQLKAFLPDGAELGFLDAQGRWSKTKHSRRTRQTINGLIAKRELIISEYDDPVLKLLEYFSTPKIGKKSKGKTLTPRQATDATRIAAEIGVDPQIMQDTSTSKKIINELDSKKLQARHSILSSAAPIPSLIKNKK